MVDTYKVINITSTAADPGPDGMTTCTEGQLIKAAIGTDWNNLSKTIQRRFEANPDSDTPLLYEGTMTEIKTSKPGLVFAFFARLLGAPLLPYSGTNIPIDVKVYTEPGKQDIFKQRTYYFPERKPATVHSRMRLDNNGEFLECVGMGLAMQMNIYAKEKALHFDSEEYQWKMLGFTIPIPLFLTPGKTHIQHTDNTDGSFRVRITMCHPWFGEMFLQDGVFREVCETENAQNLRAA